MLTVYKVDGNTRLVMPDTAWAESVLAKLEEMGHDVEPTEDEPDLCMRDEQELARRDALLEKTGL